MKCAARPPALATLFALLGAALLGAGNAAPVISAQSIIVNPVQSGLNVRVWTDRGGTSAERAAAYVPGDKIRLYTSVNQDAYVYLFNVDPRGSVDLILPNRLQGGNFLKANTPRALPDAGDPFTFDVAGPPGLNRVLALASRTPLDLGRVASFGSSPGPFATVNVRGQARLARALSVAVRPVDQGDWVSAAAYYTVVARAAAPARPAPARPAPAPLPELRGGRASFDRRASVTEVYAGYAARLRADGYRQVKRRQSGGGRLRGEFRRGTERATLEVGRQGGRFKVKLTRR